MKNQEEIKRNVSENIRSYRKKAGLTQKQLADLLGVKNTAVSNWENGQNSIDTELLFRVCKIFNISLNEIYGIEETKKESMDTGLFEKLGISRAETKKLPLLGNVACGEPIFADGAVEAFVCADNGIEADFCLRAKGDSMINARIFDGDVLFVKKQDIVDDGEIAVVIIDDEATVKHVYYDRENSVLLLVPDNPKYKTMRFVGPQLNQVRILGKVVAGQYKI